jgi:ectoine hydroxylase-related dioxygenase (phytanoyl-CoA dioxygenase family)
MNDKWTPSAAQQQHMQEHGYFILRSAISRDAAMEVRGVIRNHILTPESVPTGDQHDPMDPMGDSAAARAARFRKLNNFCVNSPLIWHNVFVGSPLPRVAQHHLGDDLLLKYNSCFLKPARTGSATPWHQDNGLWRDGDTVSFNFWMAIDPATKANGCLQFIPGTHREPIETHGLYAKSIHGELPRERVEACKAKYGLSYIELEPGDAVCWHSNLYHYSPPNTSDHSRIAVAGVFTPLSFAQRNMTNPHYHWIMRGGNICDAFPPENFVSTTAPTPAAPYAIFEPPLAAATA